LGPEIYDNKAHNTLVFPIFLYGNEIWTLKKNKKMINIIELKFFRRTGYNLSDHKRNEEILVLLKVELGDEKLRGYKSNCVRLFLGGGGGVFLALPFLFFFSVIKKPFLKNFFF